MIGEALSHLASMAALAAPSAAVGIIRCLAILLVAMAMSKVVRSAKASHCLLAVGIISMPLILVLSFTPGIELAVLPSRAPAAPDPERGRGSDSPNDCYLRPRRWQVCAGSVVNTDADTRVRPACRGAFDRSAGLAGGSGAYRRCGSSRGSIAAAVMIQAAGQAPSPDVHVLTDVGRERLGITRPVCIAIHGGNCVPFTRGTLRPVICLPRRLLELAPRQIKLIVLHELAHVRRFDTLVAAAARFACAVVWYLPPVWIAFQWLERARETACDDVVLAISPDASEYATTLVLTAKTARMPTASAVTSGAAPIGSRIRNILRPRTGKEHVMKSGIEP